MRVGSSSSSSSSSFIFSSRFLLIAVNVLGSSPCSLRSLVLPTFPLLRAQ
jgi:hypothetical protein